MQRPFQRVLEISLGESVILLGAHLRRNLLGIVALTKSTAVERFCRDALARLPGYSACGTNSAAFRSMEPTAAPIAPHSKTDLRVGGKAPG
jgi:hypothetical protein